MSKAGRSSGGGAYAGTSDASLLRTSQENIRGIGMLGTEVRERTSQIEALERDIEELEQDIAGMWENYRSDDVVVDLKDIHAFEDDLAGLNRQLDFRIFQREEASRLLADVREMQRAVQEEINRRGLR